MIKKTLSRTGVALAALLMGSAPLTTHAQKSMGWGSYKLVIDPGHSAKENRGLWGYTEAQKNYAVATELKAYLLAHTDIPDNCILLTRNNETEIIDLEERSDMANAWGADFFYSIHTAHTGDDNTTATLFGGWRNGGVDIEKTPNGGKAFGEILNPNLTDVMRTTTRGNMADRCYYEPDETTHPNQYPYLSINRRTNMASLQSDNGNCMVAAQQALNLNTDYKRLEALAAFQSIVKYRGMDVPDMKFAAGIVSNSEDGVPIDGATVTLDGKTYTTNTWEQNFSAYTDDQDLIHNGFYLFEGLEAGKSVQVTIAAKGFDTEQRALTIPSTTDGQTAEHVAWLDVALTSHTPAMVASISANNLQSVSQTKPLEITFSRKMNKETVERALSIDKGGSVTLSWTDERTLCADLSRLTPEETYTLCIDGAVARNAQTNQLFDGDGDGIEGGKYTLTFTMVKADNTPARIVTTSPAEDGEVTNTLRPVVRVVYDKQLDWDDDKYAGCLTVTDKDGTNYPGTLVHSVVGGVSMLHYFFENDLPLDKCFLVSIKSGLADLSGNLTGREEFRFLSEYREVVSSQQLAPLLDISGWWAPDGSGSTQGVTLDACTFTTANIGIDPTNPNSTKLVYDFDPSYTGGVWQIREYNSRQNINGPGTKDGVLTFWLHGDGSNNLISAMLRVRTGGRNGGMKYCPRPINFVGWNLVCWNLADDEYTHYTGTDELGADWRLDSFFLKHENTDGNSDPSVAQQAWRGEVYFNDLRFMQFDNNSVRTARIEDIVTGIDLETKHTPTVSASIHGGMLNVKTNATIRSVSIVSTDGQQVASVRPNTHEATISMAHLARGVYIVNIKADGLTKTIKVAR